MEASQQAQAHNPISHNNTITIQDQDFFTFLKINEEKRHPKYPSFFSENGLSQDIIQVTQAEPDIPLEVFYALCNTLWPQIDKNPDISLKDAWTRFIGGSVYKGTLCPPEKLMTERRIRDIRRSLSEPEGEARVFHDLDQVLNSILNLKQKIDDHLGEILYKKGIKASLTLIQEFYQDYRSKVKGLVQDIFEKEKINAPYGLESDALEDLLEPKAIMMSDIFTHHWAYRISRSQAQKLLSLDMHGRNLKSNLNDPANHRVIALPEKSDNPLVFFKANGNPPIQPEKEFMLYSLYKHLHIPVPETALLVLTDVFEANPDYFYAVQASEAVIGESPLKATLDPETTFDHEAYVSQTIGAFLTNPSDGSFKNFKYSPEYKTLISIDNDLVFKPELTGKDDKKIANLKSILYLLPQIDNPIPESVLTFFTTLDPHLTTFAWLRALFQKNQEYQLLFTRLTFQKTRCIYQNLLPQSEIPSLSTCLQQKVQVDPDIHSDSFKPQILVSQSLLNILIQKFQMIEKILSNNRSVSTQILFEELSPILGKYYRKLRFEFSDLEEALEVLWGNKKNGVDYSYISSLLDNEELSNLLSNENEINENFPPEKFAKEYKEILISGESPLDGFIRRHNQRKKRNVLNLRQVLEELEWLTQEGLTSSESPRDIVDFSHSFSKMINVDQSLIQEIISLLTNLPHAELKWLLTLEKYFLRPDSSVPNDLLQSSKTIRGALMKERTFIFTEPEKQYLFDQQGDIRKNSSLTGRSAVNCFPEKNPEFYLKQYPEWPGYELASTLFMRLLGITQLPYQDLILLNNYPALLTERVDGDPVLKRWYNSLSFQNLDPFHTTLLIISAMLLNPEDGKEDNFILSLDGRFLIPIDNDHCFLPSYFQKEKTLWNTFTVNTALQTKTLLFCLDEMNKPIPPEVQKHILSINFNLLLPRWMAEVDKIENKFNNLAHQTEQNKFLERGTVLRIPFYKPFIQSLYWKAHKIQEILKAAPQSTPFDLLKAAEPFAARCYENSFKQGHNLQTRFKAATNNLYNKTSVDGSRVSILNTRSMMEIINVSEKDLQNDAMFQRMGPVDALELLNQLIQERSQKVVLEQEMLLELDEKKMENSWISLFGNSPGEAALKAFLTNLKEGLILKGSRLITTSKLKELFTQTPNTGMRIRFLSLPGSPLLTSEEIRMLAEECPNIEYLNVSGCAKLKEIFTANGKWPLLARLEARDCLNLKKIVSYSPLKILRIETDRQIVIFVEKSTLEIFKIGIKINQFEFSLKKTEGFQLKFRDSNFSSDNFGKIIKDLHIFGEIKNYFRDTKITIGMSSISSGEDLAIFVSHINLRGSNIKIENVKTMILLNLIFLKRLDVSLNELRNEGLEALVQGNWPLLETLNLEDTKITTVGVATIVNRSNWPQLKYLDLSKNEIMDEGLEKFIQGSWPFLEWLNLSTAGLTKKGLLNLLPNINWPNLQELKFVDYGPEIFAKNLLPKNWHLLENLTLRSEKITQNEIEIIVYQLKLPQLKQLDLSGNPEITDEGFQILSQGNWPKLEILNLSGLKITTVAIEAIVNKAKWLQLKALNIGPHVLDEQSFHILAQGNWPQLEDLYLNPEGVTKRAALSFLKTNWPKFKGLYEPQFKDYSDNNRFLLNHFVKSDLSPNFHLELKNSDFTFAHLEILINQPKWSNLRSLDLSNNDIFLEVSEEKIDLTKKFPELVKLHLENTRLAPKSIKTIINGSISHCLKSLHLSNNEISDEGLSLLALYEWPLLEEFHLKNTKITSDGIEILLYKMKLPNLKVLNLSENDIFDQELKSYSSENWPLLNTLNLNKTKITTTALKAIVHQAKLPQLKHLYLDNEIDEEGFLILAQGNWPELETLWLNPERITPKAKSNFLLKANWPKFTSLLCQKDCSNLPDAVLLNRFLLKNLSQVEKLEVDSLEQEACAALENILKTCQYPKLKHLNLSNNIFLEASTVKIALAKCPELEELHLENTKLISNSLETITIHHQIKCLNISHNEIFDEGLSALGFVEWPLLEELNLKDTKITSDGIEILVNIVKLPSLKKLDISENDIFDEGLRILVSGNWSLFQHLVYYDTKVTSEGHITLLENFKWPNLRLLEHSFTESFLNPFPGAQVLNMGTTTVEDERLNYNEESPPEIILAGIPSSFQKKNSSNEDALATVLNINWLNSKEIHLLINSLEHGNLNKKAILLPRNTLDQIGHIKVSFAAAKDLKPLQPYLTNLKKISFQQNTFIPAKSLEEILIIKSNWSNLKVIDLSDKEIDNEGLQVLVSVDLQFLEELDFKNTQITDEGFEILSSGNWPLLNTLNLINTKITTNGLIAIVYQAQWPQLKVLYLAPHDEIDEEGFHVLAQGNWPELQTLLLDPERITAKARSSFLLKANWPKFTRLAYPKDSFNHADATLLHRFLLKDLSQVEKLELDDLEQETLADLENIINKCEYPKLKHLNLSNNLLETNTVKTALAKCPELEELHLENTEISAESIQTIIICQKLKCLNISHNEIFDEGLSVLSLSEWPFLEELNLQNTGITPDGIETLVNFVELPNLKTLNISENAIFDEGLGVLTSGNWPSFEHLVIENTQVTPIGTIFLLENFRWQNFTSFELSFAESFYTSSEVILATVPIYSKTFKQSLLVTVLDATWLNAKEISLFISHSGSKDQIIILPRDKLSQFEELNEISPDVLPKIESLQLFWPVNFKRLILDSNQLSDPSKLQNLCMEECLSLESVDLHKTNIPTKSLQVLTSYWPNLKQIILSENKIDTEMLQILVSANWKFLETLELRRTGISDEGVEILVAKSNWPSLKCLNLSSNTIYNKGLEMLASGNWPLLENLELTLSL